MDYSEGMKRLKREDEYKKILSKDFLIQCAESYNIEEWNTEYRKYLEKEWGYHFPEIPFSYDKVSYFFSLNASIARINYHNEDFTANGKRNKINLSNFHLQGVNFNHAILKDVCFSDAVLIGANFSETSLQGADFRRANLENVVFTAADISNANFSRSNLTNADMTQAKASNTSFMEGRLNKTKFIETKLEGANFTLSAMDGETLFHSIQIDNKTNFTSTPIDVCRIYPPKTKKILKQNIPHLDNTNNNVFVAMKFGKEDITSALENVIKPICSEYGFSAKKVDESLSPKDIPGEIKRMIDESRFVIADLTYRNAGVYFEIGYAYGIDAPIILTCNENWRIKVDKRANSLKNGSEIHKTKNNLDETDFDILTQDAVHFDIRTDRILFWSNENELKSLLEKEIQRLGIRVKYT